MRRKRQIQIQFKDRSNFALDYFSDVNSENQTSEVDKLDFKRARILDSKVKSTKASDSDLDKAIRRASSEGTASTSSYEPTAIYRGKEAKKSKPSVISLPVQDSSET